MSFEGRPQHPLQGTFWKHLKTGGVYEIIRVARIESDLTPAIVYESMRGEVWVRPEAEFMDGRFEQVHLNQGGFPNPCSEIHLTGESHVASLQIPH